MRGRRVHFLARKALLYLFVAVLLAGITCDLTLTALLTVGFAVGDASVAVLLASATRRTNRTRGDEPRVGTGRESERRRQADNLVPQLRSAASVSPRRRQRF
jgi:outer membrane receptor protein involved in Fe transport